MISETERNKVVNEKDDNGKKEEGLEFTCASFCVCQGLVDQTTAYAASPLQKRLRQGSAQSILTFKNYKQFDCIGIGSGEC